MERAKRNTVKCRTEDCTNLNNGSLGFCVNCYAKHLRKRSRAKAETCKTDGCERLGTAGKGLCSSCYRKHVKDRIRDNPPICKTPNCCKIGLAGKGFCSACYKRDRVIVRKELVSLGKIKPMLVPKRFSLLPSGYYNGIAYEHPLADAGGQVYQHRVVAYEKYGPGTQKCHWCGINLEWNELHVDHLDWQRDNNHPDNLVTSCPPCNTTRRSPKETAAIKRGNDLRALARRLRR